MAKPASIQFGCWSKAESVRGDVLLYAYLSTIDTDAYILVMGITKSVTETVLLLRIALAAAACKWRSRVRYCKQGRFRRFWALCLFGEFK